MTPLTSKQWEQVGEHYREGLDALVRIGNALRAMKAPAKAKANVIRLQCEAWNRFFDMGIDLAWDADRQGASNHVSIVIGAERAGEAVHVFTDRRLDMTLYRWAELGDEMTSALEHARAIILLVGTSIPLARSDRYARQGRRLEKLRSALDDLVVAMEPDWGRAIDVFYRGRDGGSLRAGLGPVDPTRTIAEFFNPVPTKAVTP